MAQVEFTQTFTVTGLGSGATTAQGNPALYLLLAQGSGLYIVKSLTCYSTTGFFAGSPYSVQVVANNTNSGPGTPVYSDDSGTAANVVDVIFSPSQQIILNQQYIGFNVNMLLAGTLQVIISYVFIPITNLLAGNFSRTNLSVTNTTGASFTGNDNDNNDATIIKSIGIINPTTAGSATVSLLLNGVKFSNSVVLAAGQSYFYTSPLYINDTQSITVNASGAGVPINVWYSWTQENES